MTSSLRKPHSRVKMIVLAASAGGLQAFIEILSALPANFPVPLAIVLHRQPDRVSLLPEILARHTKLRVKQAEVGELIRPGTVYVAPPNRHLVVTSNHTFSYRNGKRIRGTCSSANPLFETAAAAWNAPIIAVVLTGGDADAAEGVQAVKARGGIVLAQDPASCEVFSMPLSAIKTGAVDLVLPLKEIGPTLISLTAEQTAA